jgi:ADP-heptose:LPS heptosyltransferase
MMYRDGKQVVSHDEQHFVFPHGALGDMITSLPPVAFIRQMYPTMKFILWMPPWQIDLHKHLLAPYGEFEFRSLMDLPRDRKSRNAIGIFHSSLNTALHNTHTRCRVHMVDYAYNFLINAQPESMEQRSYLTKAPLGPRVLCVDADGKPKPYVVFPVGATSDNKLFHASVMGPIMSWCLEKGYRPVIVGTKTSHTQTEVRGELKPIVIREQTQMLDPEILERCLDMREKTTLLECRDILGHAAAVVGVDGGTLHLAGTTDVPIVYAMATALPKHRYIARHGNHEFRIRYVLPRDLECTGCQSNWVGLAHHFTECVYGDNICMEKLHPDDFINGLRELGL